MILRTNQGWLGDWKTRVGGVVAKKTHPFGLVCEAQWSLTADLGGRAVRPGACDEHTAGMGVAGLCHSPLVAPLARRIV